MEEQIPNIEDLSQLQKLFKFYLKNICAEAAY